jgi:hypothetical protein
MNFRHEMLVMLICRLLFCICSTMLMAHLGLVEASAKDNDDIGLLYPSRETCGLLCRPFTIASAIPVRMTRDTLELC